MGDDRVRKDYPEIQDDPDCTEGDDGNPGVPEHFLDKVLKSREAEK